MGDVRPVPPPVLPNSGALWHDNTVAGWALREKPVKGRSRPPARPAAKQGKDEAEHGAGWLASMPGYTKYSLQARDKQAEGAYAGAIEAATPPPRARSEPAAPRPTGVTRSAQPLLPFIPQSASPKGVPAPASPVGPQSGDLVTRLPEVGGPRREVGTRNGFNAFHEALHTLLECMQKETAQTEKEREGKGAYLLDDKLHVASVYLSRMDGVLNMAPDISAALRTALTRRDPDTRPPLAAVVAALDVFLAYALHALTIAPESVLLLREALHEWLGVPPPAPEIVPTANASGDRRTREIAVMVGSLRQRTKAYDRRIKGMSVVKSKLKNAHGRAAGQLIQRKRMQLCHSIERVLSRGRGEYLSWVFEKWREVTKFMKVLRALAAQLADEKAARGKMAADLKNEGGDALSKVRQSTAQQLHELAEEREDALAQLAEQTRAAKDFQLQLEKAGRQAQAAEKEASAQIEVLTKDRDALAATVDSQAAYIQELESRLATISATLGPALPPDLQEELKAAKREGSAVALVQKDSAPPPPPQQQRSSEAPAAVRRQQSVLRCPGFEAAVAGAGAGPLETDEYTFGAYRLPADLVDMAPEDLYHMLVEHGVADELCVSREKLKEVLYRAHLPLTPMILMSCVLLKKLEKEGIVAGVPPGGGLATTVTPVRLAAMLRAALPASPAEASLSDAGSEHTAPQAAPSPDAAPAPPPEEAAAGEEEKEEAPGPHPDVAAADVVVKMVGEYQTLLSASRVATQELLWRRIVEAHDVQMHEDRLDSGDYAPAAARAAKAPKAVKDLVEGAVARFVGLKQVAAQLLSGTTKAAITAVQNRLVSCLAGHAEQLLDIYRYHHIGRREDYDVMKWCRLEGFLSGESLDNPPGSPRGSPMTMRRGTAASRASMRQSRSGSLRRQASEPELADPQPGSEEGPGHGTIIAVGLGSAGLDIGQHRGMTPQEFFLDLMLLAFMRVQAILETEEKKRGPSPPPSRPPSFARRRSSAASFKRRGSTGDASNKSPDDNDPAAAPTPRKPKATVDIYLPSLHRLVANHVIKLMPTSAYSRLVADAAASPVGTVLRQHRLGLNNLYQKHARPLNALSWKSFKKLVDELHLPDERLTHYILSQLFLKMAPYQHLDNPSNASLTFAEFETLLTIMAVFKVPTPYVPLHVKVRKFLQEHVLDVVSRKQSSAAARKSVAGGINTPAPPAPPRLLLHRRGRAGGACPGMGDAAPRCGACSATERLQLCPCFLVRYCGKKCQAAHWPTHGWECNRVRERAKAEAEGSETPGAGSTSSHGLTDESPASKGFRTPGKEPPPPQLAPYQAAVLSAAIERVCSANPAVVAGMCMDLLMRDVAHGLPIVTRALGANVFSPDLPPSSYWHPQRPAPPAAPVPPPGVFPGPFMMPPPFTMAYPPHPPAPAPAPRDRSGSAADQVEQLMARLAAASVQDASGQA